MKISLLRACALFGASMSILVAQASWASPLQSSTQTQGTSSQTIILGDGLVPLVDEEPNEAFAQCREDSLRLLAACQARVDKLLPGCRKAYDQCNDAYGRCYEDYYQYKVQLFVFAEQVCEEHKGTPEYDVCMNEQYDNRLLTLEEYCDPIVGFNWIDCQYSTPGISQNPQLPAGCDEFFERDRECIAEHSERMRFCDQLPFFASR